MLWRQLQRDVSFVLLSCCCCFFYSLCSSHFEMFNIERTFIFILNHSATISHNLKCINRRVPCSIWLGKANASSFAFVNQLFRTTMNSTAQVVTTYSNLQFSITATKLYVPFRQTYWMWWFALLHLSFALCPSLHFEFCVRLADISHPHIWMCYTEWPVLRHSYTLCLSFFFFSFSCIISIHAIF